jgi:multicomponent Na+:H+ antiporter subunit E
MQHGANYSAHGRFSGATVVTGGRRLAFFGVLWLILTGGEAMLLSVAVVPTASWLSVRLLPAGRPMRFFALLAMAPGFLGRSLLGGIDVARRALDPRLPLDPGWVEVAVDLPDGGKVALGGELSLMPGTLAAGSDRGRLLVHVLDRKQDVEGAVRTEEAGLSRAAPR